MAEIRGMPEVTQRTFRGSGWWKELLPRGRDVVNRVRASTLGFPQDFLPAR